MLRGLARSPRPAWTTAPAAYRAFLLAVGRLKEQRENQCGYSEKQAREVEDTTRHLVICRKVDAGCREENAA